MRVTAGFLGTAILAMASLALPVSAQDSGDVLEPGDVIRSGRVEMRTEQIGQRGMEVRGLRFHTDETERVGDAEICLRSTFYGESWASCGGKVIAHDDHWDIRRQSTSLTGYQDAVVTYRYRDPDTRVVVRGRRSVSVPDDRLQSPPMGNVHLYPRGEDSWSGPGAVCPHQILRLEGVLETWDATFRSPAVFAQTPFEVQFQERGADTWAVVRQEVLHGGRFYLPSEGTLQPRDQKFLRVRAHTTGRWRIYRPELVIDGYAFPAVSYPLGLSKVLECV